MKKYCVIGEKLTHTMSPQIHKAYFDYYKKDYTYGIEQIAMQDMLVDCSNTLSKYDGFNVTVPYKEKIIKYLAGMSQEAKNIGAVSCTDIIPILTDLKVCLRQTMWKLRTKFLLYSAAAERVNQCVIFSSNAGQNV